nr:hypothetical protein [Solemoviridae sp.]
METQTSIRQGSPRSQGSGSFLEGPPILAPDSLIYRQSPAFRAELERSRTPSPTVREGDSEDLLDRTIRGVRSYAIKLLILVGLIAALALATLAVMVVIWRWFVFWTRTAVSTVFGRFSEMYGWLDTFSPSPTEEERLEKFTTLRARVLHLVGEVPRLSIISFFGGIDYLDLALTIAMIVLVGLALFVLLVRSYGVGRRVVMRARGIRMEAMMPGSAFTKAAIPLCQVQICIPGLLYDSHQGYGVRLGSHLVVPQHVLGDFSELILVGPSGKKVLIRVVATKSRLSSDLAYVFLEPNIFSTLGVVTAKTTPAFVSTYAICVGPSGASSGRVSKSTIKGVLIYEGSTLPGMSGAAYLVQGALVGIHQGGVGSTHNIGISADVMRAELARITQKESVRGSTPSERDGPVDEELVKTHTRKWTNADIEADAEERWHGDLGWAVDDGDYGGLEYQPGWEARKKKVVTPTSISINKQDGSVVQVPLTLQSPGEQGGVLDLMPAELLEYLSSMKRAKALERLGELEVLVRQLEQARPERVEGGTQTPLPAQDRQKPAKETFPCPQCETLCGSAQDLERHERKHIRHPCPECEVVCTTAQKLDNHMSGSHLTKESALAEDTGASGRIVKQTGSFLGKRASLKKNGKNLPSTSPVKGGNRRSPSLEDLLSQMLESQKSTEVLLKRFVQVSAGQSSGITQK